MFNAPGEKPIFQIQEFSYTPDYAAVENLVKSKSNGKPASKAAGPTPKPRFKSLPKYDPNKHKMYLRITFVLTIPEKYSTIPHTNLGENKIYLVSSLRS